ncbi:hypothetical protein PENTCL1PPCAC_28559, partial [Pristionchus entomophagus]
SHPVSPTTTHTDALSMELPSCLHAGATPKWKLNTALVTVGNATSGSVLQSLSSDCINCTWKSVCSITPARTAALIDSLYPTELRILHNGGSSCQINASLHSTGEYTLDATSCFLGTVAEGDDTIWASLMAVFGLLVLITSHDFYLHFKSGWWSAQEDHDEYYFGNVPRHRSSRRLLSVSVFRGLCVCMMAFANSDGGGLAQFQHSTWDGITVADLIFPAFLFCAGLSSQIAMAHQTSTKIAWSRLLNRVFFLCIIGIFVVNKGSDWHTIRIMGVLQRLALCQLIVYPIQVKVNQPQTLLRITRKLRRFPSETSEENPDEYDVIEGEEPTNDQVIEPVIEGEYATYVSHYFGEWFSIGLVYWVTLFIAIATSALTFFIRIPGCPVGYSGPGGVGDQGEFANCTGGLFGWVDRWVLGNHIYTGAPVKSVYDALDIDPEGIMGTFNSAILVAAGVLAGQILRWYPYRCEQYTRLIVYATLHLLVGIVTSKLIVPANKQLWTISFSFITAGISMYIYFVCRLAVDHVKTKIKLRALAYVGENALLIYMLQEAFAHRLPYEFVVGPSSISRVLLSLWTVLFSIAFGFALRHYDIRFKL